MTAPVPTRLTRLLVVVVVGGTAPPVAAHHIHNGSFESGINPAAAAPARRLPVDPGPVGNPLTAGTVRASRGVPSAGDLAGLAGWWYAGSRNPGDPARTPGRPWWWGRGSRPRPFPAVAAASAPPLYPDPAAGPLAVSAPDGGVGTIEKAPVWAASRAGGESAATGEAAGETLAAPGPGGLPLVLAGLITGLAGRRCCRACGSAGKNSPFGPPPPA